MKRVLSACCGALCLTLLLGDTLEAAAPGDDPRAIMGAVFARNTGDRISAEDEMTLTDASGRKRTRVMRVRAIRFADGRKSLTTFESPADVQGTRFLSFDYEEGRRADDQWLYLPAMHRSLRIAADRKSGSFMGSDFSYADLTRADVRDYEYKLLKTAEQVDGEDCWVIESTPKNPHVAEETGYLKTELWVSKQKLLVLQSKAWIRSGEKLKYVRASDVRNVQGIWTPFTLTARSVQRGKVLSETVIVHRSLKYDDPAVVEGDFTQQRLEHGI